LTTLGGSVRLQDNQRRSVSIPPSMGMISSLLSIRLFILLTYIHHSKQTTTFSTTKTDYFACRASTPSAPDMIPLDPSIRMNSDFLSKDHGIIVELNDSYL
jgi:hypothetical protein